LLAILKRFGAHFTSPRANQLPLADRWRTYCLLRDRSVELVVGAQSNTGICQGIDDQGALVLRTPAGLQRCFAGVVKKVE
jgi:biotin-(acetyl-CoA carboxylase) ligase